MNNMGPRNLLILFFSTVAVSLVILIIFFSLFFKNVDLNFNAKLPESAPDLGNLYSNQDVSIQSKAEGLLRSTINVPPEVREFVGNLTHSNDKEADQTDANLPPVSDDIIFEDKSFTQQAEPVEAPIRPSSAQTSSTVKPIERRPEKASTEPAPTVEPVQSGPPVPGQ